MTVNIIVQLLFRCFNYLLALVLDTIQLLTRKWLWPKERLTYSLNKGLRYRTKCQVKTHFGFR